METERKLANKKKLKKANGLENLTNRSMKEDQKVSTISISEYIQKCIGH